MKTPGRHIRAFGNMVMCGGALALLSLALLGAQEKPAAPATATPAAPAKEATYVGSAACKACHSKTATAWTASAHGKALMQESLPAIMKGCEACHGPASFHISSSGAENKPRIPKADDAKGLNALCGSCHFQSNVSTAPKSWQTIGGGYFVRSAHGRKGLTCLSCHSGHPNGNDKQLIKPSPGLCLGCHAKVLESSPGKKAGYTHSPVAEGVCEKCHDPHGTPSRDMVVPNVEKVCAECHDVTSPEIVTAHKGYSIATSKCAQCHDPHSHDKAAKLVKAKQHLPFKQGKCESCHTKVVAGKPVGLIKPAQELCLSCHPASVITPANQNAHVPAKQGLCLSCHNPHVSDVKSLMRTKPAYSCFACHAKIEDATVLDYRHKVLETNLDCGMCHSPHSSDQPKLQRKEETSSCRQCHKHSFSHPIGHKEDGTNVVNPVNGEVLVCSSCHNIHGSQFDALTLADKSRDLCIICHGKVEH